MNPAFPPASAPTDLGKILDLVREYTGTLREACQRELDRQFRYTVMQVITFFSLAFVVTVWFLVLRAGSEQGGTIVFVFGGSLALTVFIAGAIVVIPYLRGIGRYSPDAEEVASTVSRLVETASQFSEHASKRIADKFEFDLRLGEADAVLRMYKKVFRRKNPFTQFS